MVDSSDMWNAIIHEHPKVYDCYRFMKRLQVGDKASRFGYQVGSIMCSAVVGTYAPAASLPVLN